MFLHAALTAFASPCLDEPRRDALLHFLAGASAEGHWQATEALVTHLGSGAATPSDVTALRSRGDSSVRAMATAHHHTPAPVFTAAVAAMDTDALMSAALATTDDTRLLALLAQLDPVSVDSPEVVYHVVSHAPVGAEVMAAALSTMQLHLAHYPAVDTTDLLADHLSAHTPAAVAAALVATARFDPALHPMLLHSLVTAGLLTAHPDVGACAARAALLHAADLADGQSFDETLHTVVATLLTSPHTPPPLRRELARAVNDRQDPGTFLRALTAGTDPADPRALRACTDPLAVAALSIRWRTIPRPHLLELIAHPLLPDEVATRTLVMCGAEQGDVGIVFGRTRATETFRALCWLEQQPGWRIPPSALRPADAAAVVDLLGTGTVPPAERRVELADLLARFDDTQLRHLPWAGACRASEYAGPGFTDRFLGLVAPLMTGAGLNALAAMPLNLTVGQVLDAVTAALGHPDASTA